MDSIPYRSEPMPPAFTSTVGSAMTVFTSKNICSSLRHLLEKTAIVEFFENGVVDHHLPLHLGD